ncbi:MAG: division/cell wall cluster transcriptional repressor MraZ [Clostridia bacterium]|nr:division/cell wall cluster transcriptional repressor MraZ [Clostridia bacterium]
MLYGRYQHSVDAKGRLFVPAKLRDKLGSSFIAAVVLDRCICLYSTDEWDALLDGIASLPMTQGRALLRQLTSNAEDVAPDAQGRILLPKHLLEYAGLEKEALVIGAGKRAEIWKPAVYEETMNKLTPESMEEEFMKLGF